MKFDTYPLVVHPVKLIKSVNRFYVYGAIVRLAALAAARELVLFNI
ncbi:hypothetical protein [Coxiella-like endosymbiont]|nr:hypothetical protein [Coxiella-like endosymbiont]